MNRKLGYLFLILGILVLGSCVSPGKDSRNLSEVVPPGLNLYARLDPAQDRPLWNAMADALGVSKDIAERVDDLIVFRVPTGGMGLALRGDFPNFIVELALGGQGFKKSTKSYPWSAWENLQGELSLALISESTMVVFMGKSDALAWYATWYKDTYLASLPLVQAHDPVFLTKVYDGQGQNRRPFFSVYSDLSGINATIQDLEMNFQKARLAYQGSGALRFARNLDERVAKSLGRLTLAQAFSLLGLDPLSLIDGVLLYTPPLLTIENITIDSNSLISAVRLLAQQGP